MGLKSKYIMKKTVVIIGLFFAFSCSKNGPTILAGLVQSIGK